jgi:hypothetical protein
VRAIFTSSLSKLILIINPFFIKRLKKVQGKKKKDQQAAEIEKQLKTDQGTYILIRFTI